MSKKQYALADSNGFYISEVTERDIEGVRTAVFCKNVMSAMLFDRPEGARGFCLRFNDSIDCRIFNVTLDLEQEERWAEGGYCESN